MKTKNSGAEAYAWFKIRRYDRCADLNPLQWFQQLTLRQTIGPYLSDEFAIAGLECNDSESRSVALSSWESLKLDPIATDLTVIEGWNPGQLTLDQSSLARGVRSATVTDICSAECRIESSLGREKLAMLRSFVRCDLSELLGGSSRRQLWMDEPIGRNSDDVTLHGLASVDLTVSDTFLLESFKTWLADARRSWRQASESLSGRTAPQITELSGIGRNRVDTKEWARIGLLPCMDLLLHAACIGKKLANQKLGQLLNRDRTLTGDAARKTVRPLAKSFLYAESSAVQQLRHLEVDALNIIHRC